MDENIKEILNSVTDEIISKINPSWNKLQKIRFVYLSLGKYLEKNTDFFLNDKLADLALSKDEIDSIYFSNRLNKSIRNNKTAYQITCKSAALFLKTAFDKLGIDSYYVHTKGDLNGILHWFIVVKDDNENQLFLTLAADLPYIQNNLPTKHFGNNISLFDLNGEQVYVIPDEKGIKTKDVTYKKTDGQILHGKEIEHKVIYPEYEKDIKALDESIGFSKLYETEGLLNNKDFQKLFYIYIYDISTPYKIFRKSFNIENDYFKPSNEITKEEIDEFKNGIYEYASSFLVNKGYSNSIENAFKDTIIKLLKEIGIIEIDESLEPKTLVNMYKKDLRKIIDQKENDALSLIQTVYTLQDKFDTFYNNRQSLNDEDYTKSKKAISISKLVPLLDKLAYIELKEKLTVKTHEYLPLSYIVTKFNLVFPIVFDCNFKTNKTVKVTPFSMQGYSEQIVIIKEFLKRIFSELSEQNCIDIDEYDKKYTPVENRIQTFPLKNRETGEYCIGFDFGGKDEENTVNYIFIPSKNLLRKRDPIKDLENYWIVSQRFNKELQALEDIEEKESPRIKY